MHHRSGSPASVLQHTLVARLHDDHWQRALRPDLQGRRQGAQIPGASSMRWRRVLVVNDR
jgi:hypothetical protein